MVLYHVTIPRNVASVLRSGLKTSHARGPKGVVWLCDREHLAWTIGHVARCKGRGPSTMRVLRVACGPDAVTCVRPGTYFASRDIPGERISRSVLDALVLQAQE
jgi:hypothetical protein